MASTTLSTSSKACFTRVGTIDINPSLGTDFSTQQLHVDVVLLRAEMKTCSTQVAKLTKEFDKFKKVVEAAQSEVDATRLIVVELTNKLKDL